MDDKKKKIAGTVFVGIVIFLVGLLSYEALTPDLPTKEEIEVEVKSLYRYSFIDQEKCLDEYNGMYNLDYNECVLEEPIESIIIHNQQIIIEFLKNQTGD